MKPQKTFPVPVSGCILQLTLEQIEALRITLGEIIDQNIDVDPIVKLVALRLNIPISRILSDQRDNETVLARWCIAYLCHKRGMDYQQIGKVINRHRDLARYGIVAIQERRHAIHRIRTALEKVEAL